MGTTTTIETITTTIKTKMPDILDSIFPSSIKAKYRLIKGLQIKFLQANLLSEEEIEFMWSTAGHSASAAHGNIFNESYTSLLQDTVYESFQAINLQFMSCNYAMGGMSSSPELSLCEQSVYGTTIDILLWDFGMTVVIELHCTLRDLS